MAKMALDGKKVLVTGAASGIGRSAAIRLAADGAAAAIVDRRVEGAHVVAREIAARGGVALEICADVGCEEQVIEAFDVAEREIGALDVVVANAGIYLGSSASAERDAAVHELSSTAWETTLRTNLTGVFLTCKYGVRALLANGGGSIVIIGSPTGEFGMELGAHAYSASKAGVHGLARVMANEYAKRNIRVNVVLPGLTKTSIDPAHHGDPGAFTDVLTQIPLGRAATPEEISPMIAFLASDDASYVTGALFHVDGGLTAV